MVTVMNMASISEQYRTEFSITGPKQAENSLFGRVCEFVRDCFDRLPGDREPVEESGEFEEVAFRRFQMTLPHGRNLNFQLRLDVKLSTRGGAVAVSVQSAFVETNGAAPPPELIAGPPRLVLELLGAFECYYGTNRLSSTPVRVASDAAAEFASRIFDPDRRLPILAISENWRRQTPVNPNWLQQLLAGVAEVTTYDSNAADELRRHVGFQLACFNGAMRIYQPGCSRDDRREQHRFWMPGDAATALRRPVGRVVQELVRHFPEFADSRQFENVRGQVQQRRIAELTAERLAFPLRQRIEELESEIDSLRQELQGRESKAAEGVAKLHGLHQELVNRDSELDVLRTQLEQAIRRGAEHEPEIARLHQQQTDRDERIESLRQQLELALSHVGAGQSEVAQLHSQLLERDSQIESLRQELDKATHKEAEAEQELELLHVRIQESDEQVESLRKQLEDAAGEEDISQAAIAELETSLQERDSELGVLRAQLEDARSRSNEIGNLIAELNKELEIRDTDITNLRLLLEGVEEGSTDSEAIIGELRKELQEREDNARAIGDLLEKARNRADAAENVAEELRRELGRHLAESDALDNIIQESRSDASEARAKTAQANRDIAELRQQSEAFRVEIGGLERQLEEAREEISRYLTANENLESRLKGREDEIRGLRYQLGTGYLPAPEETEYYEELPEFDRAEDAVMYADQHFDKLRFLNSAFESADGYPYQNPHEVYDAFSLLQQLAIARGQGSLGMNPEDWMRERGCDCSSRESRATMQMYGDQRWFGGYEMQEHIKIGKGTSNKHHYIRIHFAWQEESQQYVVGHVGEHLPTATGG